jgi:drug/metabolite transporter (DMT)-like permease
MEILTVPELNQQESRMKIAGILLIVAGIVALIYGGFSYTSHKKAVDLGAIQIDTTEHHTLPVPPLLGIVAIAGGGCLIYFGARQGR